MLGGDSPLVIDESTLTGEPGECNGGYLSWANVACWFALVIPVQAGIQ